jgi:hypothetical protein
VIAKTSELTGAALDWAVARSEEIARGFNSGFFTEIVLRGTLSPSTVWAQGGPIIEREAIGIYQAIGRGWCAAKQKTQFRQAEWCGATPLIAAMRCYVASKLGDEVDIPEELT